MDSTVYIPNLNGRARLRMTLESVRRQTTPCHVVVVDNGSTDGTVEMLARDYPEHEVVALTENLGFGRALNQAIRAHGTGPVILLNNDVILEPEFIEEITRTAESTGAEMVASVLLRADRPGEIDSAGIVADDETLMAFDFLEGLPVQAVESAAAPLGPSGGAALYDRECFLRAGGFDEEIFAYYEDLDLALRMRIDGCRCALAKNARGTHLRSATLGPRSATKYGITGWSRGYLIRRYGLMESPRGILRTLAFESLVCLGQILFERTASGIRGRVKGFRAGRDMPRRPLPTEGLSHISARRAIRDRLQRLP